MSKMEMPEIKNYGLTTIGQRGQVVIPKEIRDKLKIKAGEKFLVFTKGDDVISLIKPENFDKLIREFVSYVEGFKKIKK